MGGHMSAVVGMTGRQQFMNITMSYIEYVWMIMVYLMDLMKIVQRQQEMTDWVVWNISNAM